MSTIPAGSATPVATRSATPSADGDDSRVTLQDLFEDATSKNIVQIHNQKDGRLRLRSNVQLNRIKGSTVEPVNVALALSGALDRRQPTTAVVCTGCQTMAVALQINLYRRGANVVTPQNAALAINSRCNQCKTFSWALQYNVPVDDPGQPPEDVRRLVRDMDRALRDSVDRDTTVDQAKARVEAVLTQFRQLGDRLLEQRDEEAREDSPENKPPVGTIQPGTLGATTTATVVSTATAVGPAATSTVSPTSGAGAASPVATGTPTPTG